MMGLKTDFIDNAGITAPHFSNFAMVYVDGLYKETVEIEDIEGVLESFKDTTYEVVAITYAECKDDLESNVAHTAYYADKNGEVKLGGDWIDEWESNAQDQDFSSWRKENLTPIFAGGGYLCEFCSYEHKENGTNFSGQALYERFVDAGSPGSFQEFVNHSLGFQQTQKGHL